MNKTFRYISMAALALVGTVITGCAGEELTTDTPQTKDNTVTMTTTVTLGGASTRALDASGKKTFSAGEMVAVIYQTTTGVAKAVSEPLQDNDIASEGKTAKFTITLDNPKDKGHFRMIYPASLAQQTIAATEEFDDATLIDFTVLQNQDGKLESLAFNLDLAIYDGELTEAVKLTETTELPATLPAVIALENQLAIGAFTIKDATDNDITSIVTKLTIEQGSDTYIIQRTADAGPIYVAMQYCDEQDITVKATDGIKNYTKSVTKVSLAQGTIYSITVAVEVVP